MNDILNSLFTPSFIQISHGGKIIEPGLFSSHFFIFFTCRDCKYAACIIAGGDYLECTLVNR